MPVLTAVAVANFKPRHRRYEVRDTRSSLRLVVFPTGAKSWIIRYRRRDGRSAKFTLGPVNTLAETEGTPVVGGPLTLAAARKLAAEIDLDRASGRDPAMRKTRAPIPVTFAAAAHTFITEYAARKQRRWKDTARILGLDPDGAIRPKGICDRWHDKPLIEIGATTSTISWSRRANSAFPASSGAATASPTAKRVWPIQSSTASSHG